MRVYKLAQQLSVSSKKVLDATLELNISATSHLSSLSEDEVKRVIQYFEKNKRAGLLFNKSFLSVYEVIKSTLMKKSFVSGLLIGIGIFTVFGFSISNSNENLNTVEDSGQINNVSSTTIEVDSSDANNQDVLPPLFTDEDKTTTTTVPTTTTTTVPTTVLVKYLVVGSNCSYSIIEVDELDDRFSSGMTLKEAQTTKDEFNTWRCVENTTTIPVSTNYTFEQNYTQEQIYESAIDIDSSNNLYVAGTYYRTDTTIGSQTLTNYGADDIFVYKLNHLGDLEWLKTFGNSSNNAVHDIAVDQSGNTIVTGYFIGSLDFGTGTQTATGGGSTFILKLDQNGDTDWVVTSTSGERLDYGFGVDTDSTGNIYIAGIMQQKTTNTSTSITFGTFTLSSVNVTRSFYMKINPSGDVQWLKTVTGSHNYGYRVFVDSQDNKYLIGSCKSSDGVSTFSNVDGSESTTLSCSTTSDPYDVDLLIVKLDSSDNYVWHWNDRAYVSTSRDIIVNSSGDVFATYYVSEYQTEICGTSIDAGTENYYYVLVKLDSTGTCQWFYKYDRSTNDRNIVLHLGLDSSDNIYFLNEYIENINGLNYRTRLISVFSDQGVQQNSLNLNSLNGYVLDFVFDSDDNIYLFGSTQTIKRSLSDLE